MKHGAAYPEVRGSHLAGQLERRRALRRMARQMHKQIELNLGDELRVTVRDDRGANDSEGTEDEMTTARKVPATATGRNARFPLFAIFVEIGPVGWRGAIQTMRKSNLPKGMVTVLARAAPTAVAVAGAN